MVLVRFSKRVVIVTSFLVPLVLAFIVRVYLCYATDIPWYLDDTYAYLKQADAIRQGSWINIFPNGYPLIIVLVSSIFRSIELSNLLIWVNIILSTVIVSLVYFITFKQTRQWALAALAALVIAIWPNHIIYVPQLLSDIPATFFLVAGTALAMINKPLWSGMLIGVATSIRTSLMLVPLFDTIFFVWKREFRKAVIFFAASIIPVLAISGYSYFRVGEFASSGYTAANILVAVDTYGAKLDTRAFDVLYDAVINKHEINYPSTTEAVKLYLTALKNNPEYFLKQRLSALWELWGYWPEAKEGRSNLARALIGLRFPVLLLALLSFVYKKRRDVTDFLLITPALGLTIIHTVLFGKARFIVPAEPLLIILAIQAFVMIAAKLYPNASIWRCLGIAGSPRRVD